MKNDLAVLITKENGDVQQVYRAKNGRLTLVRDNAVKFRFKTLAKPEIKRWAKKHGYSVAFSRKDNPFIVYDTDTGRVKDDLEKRLNEIARDIKRRLFIGEGKRSNKQQWEFRMGYLRGYGNLAARCCTKYWPDVIHSWDNCGKNSQSNHASGSAADTMVLPGYVNLGAYPGAVKAMKEHGVGLPVGPYYKENWHVEVSNSFAGL